jgi:hypothetical protein
MRRSPEASPSHYRCLHPSGGLNPAQSPSQG